MKHFTSETKKRLSSAALCVLFTFFLLVSTTFAPGCSSENANHKIESGTSENTATDKGNQSDATNIVATFDAFTKNVFCEEIAQNMINLHFTLAHPENFGITNYEANLGDLSMETITDSYAKTENYLITLKQFDQKSLPLGKQLTYDVLIDSFDFTLEMAPYILYDEILAPSSGIHAQLPILLEEYLFYDEQDVKDYLTILASTKDYFSQIIEFEKKKIAAGLFMPDFSCDSVISQCKDFVASADEHFLIETFNKRINELEGISGETRADYIAQNEKLVKEDLVSAYQFLSDEMTALLGNGTNERGLCYFPNGREYYEHLVYYYTGSKKEVPLIQQMISDARTDALFTCSVLANEDSSIYEKCSAAILPKKDASATLDELKIDLLQHFPAAPETSYTVNYIDECIAEYVAPAYYIIPPVDDYSKNSIHINAETDATSLNYFTTLAHEGFPGHLYQTVMSYEAELDLIRNLLYYGGYTEGWATYVEMISYQYADVDANAASFLQNNQSALLSLYASTDLGIHYDGWTKEETADFWRDYGITDAGTLNWIYEYIVGEPGSYLKYYVGYLEFLELKEYAMETFGNTYNDISFHQALLDIGPAPFAIVKEYLDDYYRP